MIKLTQGAGDVIGMAPYIHWPGYAEWVAHRTEIVAAVLVSAAFLSALAVASRWSKGWRLPIFVLSFALLYPQFCTLRLVEGNETIKDWQHAAKLVRREGHRRIAPAELDEKLRAMLGTDMAEDAYYRSWVHVLDYFVASFIVIFIAKGTLRLFRRAIPWCSTLIRSPGPGRG